MGLQDVRASFVVYPADGNINISARSLGDINVQLVMEQLGGGGHQTMAGAQIEHESVEHVKSQLMEIIDSLGQQ